MGGVDLTITVSPEKYHEVRKWVDGFYKEVGSLERFWWAVGVSFNKNGRFPQVNDILWGMMNEDRTEAFAKGHAGVYCNVTMSMCNLLHHEGRFEPMFKLACQFTAMQCAGAQNSHPDKPFDQRFAFLGSACLPSIYYAACGCDLDFADIEAEFAKSATAIFDDFGATNSDELAQATWQMVRDGLFELFEARPAARRFRVTAPNLSG